MNTLLTPLRTELARRSSASADVDALLAETRRHRLALRVRLRPRTETYFEIPAEPYLALDIYHQRFVYSDFSTVEGGAGV